MKLRKDILLLFCMLCLTTIAVDKYKVLRMNHPKIYVDGKLLHVGDTIYENSDIQWKHQRQAIKVIDLQNMKHLLLVADANNTKKNDKPRLNLMQQKTLYYDTRRNVFTRKGHSKKSVFGQLGTLLGNDSVFKTDSLYLIRKAQRDSVEHAILNQSIFCDSYFMMDEPILIPVPPEVMKDSCMFTMGYNLNHKFTRRPMKYTDGHLILDHSLFNLDGEQMEPCDLWLFIEYIDKSTDIKISVKDINIVVIPEKLSPRDYK